MRSLLFTLGAGFALFTAVSGRSKNEPQSGELSIQGTRTEDVVLSDNGKMQKQEQDERKAIIIFEERMVAYNGGDWKSRMRRNVGLYEDDGSGERLTTPIQSPETTSTPEASGDGFTVPEGSGDGSTTPGGNGDILTSAVKPESTTTNPNPPLQCQNGGSSNGNICVCATHFFGDRCEFISGRIQLGAKVNVTVDVELEFVNRNFHENLQDISSEEYRNFETIFKGEMTMVYKDIPGYKDVEILAMRSGSIIVNHLVVVEVEYTFPVDLNEKSRAVFDNVKTQLEILRTGNCTGGSSSLCIDRTTYKIEAYPVPTLEELCRKAIPDNFENYFTPRLTHSGVICLSDCEKESPNHQDCNNGICLILPNTGAQCSCANMDEYIYTSGNCKDKVSKSALYGGIGAAIGVLAISLLIIGILQFKQWRRKNRDAIKDVWYSDTDEVWTNNYSTIKCNDDSFNSESVTESFRPALDKINPSIEVKTKRPSISRT